ncbi:S8 family serine peptidase [Lysobacter xanthus]
MSIRRHRLRASLLAAAILTAPLLAEARRLDAQLEALLPTTAATDSLQVIVSFNGAAPLTAEQRQRLASLGVRGITLRDLPIAGVLATPAQIRSLLAMSDVRSVWLNKKLQYDNYEATRITGVQRLRTESGLRVNGMPVTGRGIGVLINDSGVDGTHPDLKYPEHVKQNVLGQTNLAAQDALLPITYVENVANTDIGGGHGSHVAGIVGGNGAASPGGKFEGVAPGASIIGYGSGAGLFILDTLGGFDYALTHQAQYNIRVVSNSFGNTGDTGTDFDPDDPTNIATKKLADRGVIVVFSAGNSGAGEATITGNFKKAPWVVTVAAGDKSGRLADFSSRGENGRGGTVSVDGTSYMWEDRPTVTAPGVDIVSVRASTGAVDKTGAQGDVETLGTLAAYYATLSGTSMAAPHTSGIVALMLEANPNMDWRDVKRILQETASNLPGGAKWEVGAGYINAYAAVQSAVGQGRFGPTVNAARTFNANAQVSTASARDYAIDFSPVGPTSSVQFQVGADIALVNARAAVGDNTVAISLTDPNGKRYGSSIALPVLGENIAVSAPGVAGTWTLTVRGVGSVSGTNLDPAKVTNGYGVPGTVNVNVKQLRTDGYTGLRDVATHASRGFVEFGVSNRLVDSYADGTFQPDRVLTRGELADFLVMGAGIRQFRPLANGTSVSDLGAADARLPAAEAVLASGASQRDLSHRQAGVMGRVDGAFRPDDVVTRASLSYSLVQSLGLQAQAEGFSGTLTALYDGKRVEVKDDASIPAPLRGYVQYALDLGLVNARFEVVQGPFDLQPTVVAYFDPAKTVTRGAYAAAASRLFAAYGL